MPYLLDFCYVLLILLSLPWLVKESLRKGKYREGFAAKFLGIVPRRKSTKRCLWFHAVSVGEVNLLEPLLKKDRPQRPDWECVVSTTTKTGMVLAQRNIAVVVFYCPLDFTWAVGAASGAGSARRAGAGRVGALAEPNPRGETAAGRRWRSSTAA